MTKPTRKDWLLQFIAGTDQYDGPVDAIRLMKGMFLFQEEGNAPIEVNYRFRPYDYGPFTPEIYRDAEALAERGLLVGSRAYRATEPGRQHLASLGFDSLAERQLIELRVEVTDLSFRALLRRVYSAHPESAARSIAKDVMR